MLGISLTFSLGDDRITPLHEELYVMIRHRSIRTSAGTGLYFWYFRTRLCARELPFPFWQHQVYTFDTSVPDYGVEGFLACSGSTSFVLIDFLYAEEYNRPWTQAIVTYRSGALSTFSIMELLRRRGRALCWREKLRTSEKGLHLGRDGDKLNQVVGSGKRVTPQSLTFFSSV